MIDARQAGPVRPGALRCAAKLRARAMRGGWLFAVAAVLLFVAACLQTARAQSSGDPAPLAFKDIAEETRFHALTAELRCVMCQNQSLADSNAQIAHDLRREVLNLMRQGKTDDEVIAFLVARYGEFVRYKPAFEPGTWLLWLGPTLLLIAGAVVVWRVVVSRSRADLAAPGEEQEW